MSNLMFYAQSTITVISRRNRCGNRFDQPLLTRQKRSHTHSHQKKEIERRVETGKTPVSLDRGNPAYYVIRPPSKTEDGAKVSTRQTRNLSKLILYWECGFKVSWQSLLGLDLPGKDSIWLLGLRSFKWSSPLKTSCVQECQPFFEK